MFRQIGYRFADKSRAEPYIGALTRAIGLSPTRHAPPPPRHAAFLHHAGLKLLCFRRIIRLLE